jgi:hypothetical protein
MMMMGEELAMEPIMNQSTPDRRRQIPATDVARMIKCRGTETSRHFCEPELLLELCTRLLVLALKWSHRARFTISRCSESDGACE